MTCSLLFHESSAALYLKPARKFGAMVGAMNTVNTVHILNIANIVDFNAMRYKKQYNDSSQVLVICQTGNSIV